MRNELPASVFSPEVDEHVVNPFVFRFRERRRRCEVHQTNSGQPLERESNNGEMLRENPEHHFLLFNLLNELLKYNIFRNAERRHRNAERTPRRRPKHFLILFMICSNNRKNSDVRKQYIRNKNKYFIIWQSRNTKI